MERERNPNRIRIGQELIRFGSFYKLYGTYFGNRLRSEALLRELFEKHGEEMRLVEERFKGAASALEARRENMTMSDCLQQPQYRMFKYVLLLKDYVRKMPRWHADYGSMVRALEVFE